MKYLILLALLIAGCSNPTSTDNYKQVEGYIIYSKTIEGNRIFEAYQTNLNEELISISVSELPFEPIRLQLFYFEGSCKKYTNVCSVDKIVGVSYRYP